MYYCALTLVALLKYQVQSPVRLIHEKTQGDALNYHSESVRYKTRTGLRPGLIIKCGLTDCMYAMLIRLLSLMRF